MGTLALSSDSDPVQAAAALIQSKEAQAQVHGPNGIPEAIVIDNTWKPSHGGKISTNCGLVMENVADGYKRPNILDVKLGARLWADDAPPAKRAKLDKVAGETTSELLGYRVAGMRIWQGPDTDDQKNVNLDGYKLYDKDYGRGLTAENVIEGFEDYFRVARGTRPPRNTRKLIRRFIEDLEGMQAVLENEESRMYSASLLFVYEGDPRALQDALSQETQILDTMEAKITSLQDGDGVHEDKRDGDTILDGDGITPAHRTADGNTRPPDGNSATSQATSIVDDTAHGEIPLPRIQALKLIDFAHAAWTPGQGPDENLLHGIRNVIKTLQELLA